MSKDRNSLPGAATEAAPTMDTRAIPPATPSMEKIMNTHINRRALVALSAVGVAATASAEAALHAHDPLIDVVEAYRAGMAAYNEHPIHTDMFPRPTEEEEDAVIAATYGPPYEMLRFWDQTAVTFAGATAALRFARDECEVGDVDIMNNMITAALSYFEREGRP